MALRLILVAKFLGPSSSAPEGGPRGCLKGWLTNRWETMYGIGSAGAASSVDTWTAEAGLPIPNPSYNFFEASSRGERGISLEEDEWGVVGDEWDPVDLYELVDELSSLSLLSEVSMVTLGRGC